MKHALFSRSTWWLLLPWAVLAGCSTPTPTPSEQTADVQFNVTVPPETPLSARVLLQGEHPGFSGLLGHGLELVYQGGRLYTATTKLPRDQSFTYDVRILAPEQGVALDAAGGVVPARTVSVQDVAEQVDVSVERWGPASGQTGPQTVFLVSVPENTPPEDTLWLAGNQPQLGEWNPSGVKLQRAVDHRYTATLSFEPGTSLEFKVTRGTWGSVENSAVGQPVDNHVHKTAGGFERLTLPVANWEDLYKAPVEHTLSGNVESLEVSSTYATQAQRTVLVWLPPGYEKAENAARRYPVLYMHDGQNLMDAATSFAGEWKVDETAGQLIEAGTVEPVIIVGVYNAGENRAVEYTQVPDPAWPEVKGAEGGKADGYGRFLAEELKPLIDGKYRTRTGAQDTGLVGSSLGGLVSLYLGLTHPGTFSRLGVVSPSVFWGQRDILARVDALPGKPSGTRIWLDIGTEEGSNGQETVADTAALRDRLVAKGWVLGGDLKYTEVPGAHHNEAAWSARFGELLTYLFPAP